MKPLSPEERRIALDAFAPIDAPTLEVLDRSTLERWSNCPFQASAIEAKRVTDGSLATASGQEVHDAISKATRAWIESDGHIFSSHEARQMLINELEGALRDSRPDVQPDVLAGCRASIWAFAKYMSDIHPGNVIAFDGGEDLDEPRGGQLAVDFPELGVRATSELDLLHSTDCPEVAVEIDFKSGRKYHSESAVASAFQFQMHADLVFENFPLLKALDVAVWDTRTNHQTYKVRFERRRQPEYRARIRKAIEVRALHRNNPPCWPMVEKCSMCDAALLCPAAGEEIKQIHDPVAAVRTLIAKEASADALKDLLTAWVDKHGEIKCGDVWFGREKPREKRSPATIYGLSKKKGKDTSGNA